MKYTIGIVDDNVKLAQQLQVRLALIKDVSVLFYTDRGKKAIQWFNDHTHQPDIVLMDIEMPEMDGIQTTFELKQQFPKVQIIMLTIFDNEENIFNAIKAGATGYLMKEEKIVRIRQAFEDVMDGGAPMSPMIAQKSLNMLMTGFKPKNEQLTYNSGQEELTKREMEILELLAMGYKNQGAADKLFISMATVKKHVENIYQKLQLHSRVELLNWYKQ
jgi:DNA-binding NarL/FixJ family response regulator